MKRPDPLIPLAVARAVCDEAGAVLRCDIPAHWPRILARKAEIIRAHNPRFNRLLHKHGDQGREWLYCFMRHWLAAMLKRHQPAAFANLPSGFANGHPPLSFAIVSSDAAGPGLRGFMRRKQPRSAAAPAPSRL